MAKFNDSFKLNIDDIDIIEKALRNEIGKLADRFYPSDDEINSSPAAEQTEGNEIRRLHVLLGKLHNQKIWYGQANTTGIPISG